MLAGPLGRLSPKRANEPGVQRWPQRAPLTQIVHETPDRVNPISLRLQRPHRRKGFQQSRKFPRYQNADLRMLAESFDDHFVRFGVLRGHRPRKATIRNMALFVDQKTQTMSRTVEPV